MRQTTNSDAYIQFKRSLEQGNVVFDGVPLRLLESPDREDSLFRILALSVWKDHTRKDEMRRLIISRFIQMVFGHRYNDPDALRELVDSNFDAAVSPSLLKFKAVQSMALGKGCWSENGLSNEQTFREEVSNFVIQNLVPGNVYSLTVILLVFSELFYTDVYYREETKGRVQLKPDMDPLKGYPRTSGIFSTNIASVHIVFFRTRSTFALLVPVYPPDVKTPRRRSAGEPITPFHRTAFQVRLYHRRRVPGQSLNDSAPSAADLDNVDASSILLGETQLCKHQVHRYIWNKDDPRGKNAVLSIVPTHSLGNMLPAGNVYVYAILREHPDVLKATLVTCKSSHAIPITFTRPSDDQSDSLLVTLADEDDQAVQQIVSETPVDRFL